jgi:acetyltransferase-like isoleucine patch superfamily enzyme
VSGHSRSVASARWAFAVNGIAGSPYVGMQRRARILRRHGLELGNAQIWPRCYFHTADIHIADGVILNHGVHIENVARVEIGERTALGPFATIITSAHDPGDRSQRPGKWKRLPVTIGSGCWIGARALILADVTIGDGCVIAAGAVVTSDCAPDGLYAGVPARRVRDL